MTSQTLEMCQRASVDGEKLVQCVVGIDFSEQ